MRAIKPAQPVEPTEAIEMPSPTNSNPPMGAQQIPNVENEPPLPPVAPETGPSPDQDMSHTVPHLDPLRAIGKSVKMMCIPKGNRCKVPRV